VLTVRRLWHGCRLSVRLSSVADVLWLNGKSYRGLAIVPSDRALATFYRLSMSPSLHAAVWPQISMEDFKL